MITFHHAKIVGSKIDPESYHKQMPGVKRGDPEYVMSRGSLLEVQRCASRWLAGVEEDDTKSTEWGSLIDAMALDGPNFEKRYAIRPDTYFDDKGVEKDWHHASNTCKAWLKKHSDKVVISCEQADRGMDALEKLRGDERIKDLVDCSLKQTMIVAEVHESETGIAFPIRVLIDLVPDQKHKLYGDGLGDLKTCADASYRGWAKKSFLYGYHVQAALYLDQYNAATDETRKQWFMPIQESFPPYQVGRRQFTTEFIGLGRHQYKEAARYYSECLKTGLWPDYDAKDAVEGWGTTKEESWMTKIEANSVPARTADEAMDRAGI